MRIQNVMSSRISRVLRSGLTGAVILAAAMIIGSLGSQPAVAGVPTFLFNLTYPGNQGQFLDPGNVYFDPRHGEIFVTDVRNWRIVIFDKRGRYSFDFSDPEHLGGARQVVVDSLGRIYVLRSDPQSVVSVFEYNGEYQRELRFTDPGTGRALNISGIALDEKDRMYVLSVQPAHVYTYTTGGEMLSDFTVFADDSVLQNEPAFGSIAVVNGKLVIPVPIEGDVVRFTTDGQQASTLGSPGDGEDEFSLPIAAAGDENGNVYVLDKHKHSILEFDDSGKWLRVMGGRGMSPGWFYHPTCLAMIGNGEAIVGQTYLGRIQTVSLAPADPNADIFSDAATPKN